MEKINAAKRIADILAKTKPDTPPDCARCKDTGGQDIEGRWRVCQQCKGKFKTDVPIEKPKRDQRIDESSGFNDID